MLVRFLVLSAIALAVDVTAKAVPNGPDGYWVTDMDSVTANWNNFDTAVTSGYREEEKRIYYARLGTLADARMDSDSCLETAQKYPEVAEAVINVCDKLLDKSFACLPTSKKIPQKVKSFKTTLRQNVNQAKVHRDRRLLACDDEPNPRGDIEKSFNPMISKLNEASGAYKDLDAYCK